MTLVVIIWLAQAIAIAVIVFNDAELSGFGERLLRIVRSRSVIILACGLVGFILAGWFAAVTESYRGLAAATTSFYVQGGLLLLAIIAALFAWRPRGGGIDMVFGSARFASIAHAHRMGLIGESGIRLGTFRHPEPKLREEDERQGLLRPLHYTGERHLLTVAPTRAGKGVTVIIPNLLSWRGSCIVIDPKGENAAATAAARSAIGAVHVLDPWGIATESGGAARFNPIDLLTPDSPTLIEDAMLIADALVVSDNARESANTAFWSDEARALIMGYILHIATASEEAGQRDLGRLRDMLCATPDEQMDIGLAMARSPMPAVSAAAARFVSKSDNERSGVLSTAQANTHFLDSPALRQCLAQSSFRFADLKRDAENGGTNGGPVSVYIVLPVDRLSTYSRWLRLLIALGIADLARTNVRTERPVWFVLDEFAQLGRLKIIEDAYGLMAGLGIQLHAIVQDLSQLERLYGAGWQTFVANAGVIQVFGTRDLHTADYVSKMLGMTTRLVTSSSTGTSGGTGPDGGSTSGTSSTTSTAPAQRPLLFPDELMRMDRNAQILFIEGADPVLADKLAGIGVATQAEKPQRIEASPRIVAALPRPAPAQRAQPAAAPNILAALVESVRSRLNELRRLAVQTWWRVRGRFSSDLDTVKRAQAARTAAHGREKVGDPNGGR